jgi:hypothetical protein
MRTEPNLKDALLTDLWVHFAGLIAIAVGLFGNKYLGLGWSNDTLFLFVIGGFAAMGLKLTNGTIAATANAAAEAVRVVATEQAASLVQTATQQAAGIVQTAQKTADAIPPKA